MLRCVANDFSTARQLLRKQKRRHCLEWTDLVEEERSRRWAGQEAKKTDATELPAIDICRQGPERTRQHEVRDYGDIGNQKKWKENPGLSLTRRGLQGVNVLGRKRPFLLRE